jgi:hypothetical protein
VEHAGARRFVIDVQRAGERYAGRLVVEQGAARTSRELTSARCKDLVDALVLFTAIAIDAGPEPQSESPPPPATPPTSEAPPPPPTTTTTTTTRREAAPPPPPAPAWHLAVGSGGFAATGVADSAMLAAHPVIDLASSASGLSASFRLGLIWANGGSQSAPIGGLNLRLRALVLSGCALRVPFGDERADVRLCAAVEGGVLELRPFAIANPTTPDRPWFAAGPMLRVGATILPRILTVGADAGLAIPFEREHAYVVGPTASGPAASGPTVELVKHVGVRLAAVVLLQVV